MESSKHVSSQYTSGEVMYSKDASVHWCTELSPIKLLTSLCHLQYLVISSMQIRRQGESLGNLVTCSDVRRIRRKTHCTNSQIIDQYKAGLL